VPLSVGISEFPSDNVAWAEAYLHTISNHPTVRSQYTNVTDRTGHYRQRSDSIERTVLRTVALKQFVLCYQTIVCLVMSCL